MTLSDRSGRILWGGDDAVHILDPERAHHTLCGGVADGLNTVALTEPRPDSFGGCWTCLETADSRHG